jgi:hypothetical protein
MHQPSKKLHKTPAPILFGVTMNRSCPLGVIAEIMFRENLCPVFDTTWVFPLGAQVVPGSYCSA